MMARTIQSGTSLHVVEGGRSGGPTLLLLHGLGANGEVWAPLVAEIEREWPGRWIAPDLRGHGRSDHRPPYSYAAYACDAASLFDQGEEIIAIGHSMGGLIAIALASGWFGVRVRQSLAFGVKIRWTSEEHAKLAQLAQAPVRWFDKEEEAIDRYLKVSGLIGLVPPSSAAARSGIHTENGRCRLAADPLINAAAGPDIKEFVAAARSPFRLAAGADDPMVTLADMTPLDPRAVVFAGLGHNAHVQDPQAVWNFLRGAMADNI